MDEFALIDLLLERLGEQKGGPAIVLGPGDDSALIDPVPGQWLVSSIDTLVADVHFPAAAGAELIGYRSMAVSVSDLAAMGADPLYCLIALTLPDGSPEWLDRFASGVAAAAFAFRCPVAGGNIARGPLSVSISVHGQVPANAALRRDHARPGHHVLVSGRLGAAAAALADPALARAQTLAEVTAVSEDPDAPLARYYLPTPRLELGRALRGIAAAAIDLSDGLVADLGHICRASGCGAEIAVERVPRSDHATLLQALSGGDDYELCVTVPSAALRRAHDIARAIGIALTDVGHIVARDGVVLQEHGRPWAGAGAAAGFRHFD
jgi:thiamine-monophosphate kinase